MSSSLQSHVLYSPLALLSMEIPTKNTGVDIPFFPGDLPYPGIKPLSPALQADSCTAELLGKPPGDSLIILNSIKSCYLIDPFIEIISGSNVVEVFLKKNTVNSV